jgi:CheY-like chemotaxis protein
VNRTELEIEPGWLGALRAGRILFVADPRAFHAPLCPALERRAFAVTIRSSLGEAIDALREEPVSCIVVDGDLKDGLGLEIARALRAHAAHLRVPLACVTAEVETRIEALAGGADVALAADDDPDFGAAQIDALVRLAARLTNGAGFRLSPPYALEGDAGVVPLPTLLTALGYERRSGILEAVADGVRAHIEIVDGHGVSGAVEGARGGVLDALRTILGWSHARFAFTSLPLHGAAGSVDLRTLCVEALRLLDEQRRRARIPAASAQLAAAG